MNPRSIGFHLTRLGVLLFLLALFTGIAIPKLAVPRLGLSTHLLGLMQGTFLIAIGQLWPKLKLSPRAAFATGIALAYGCVAAWLANLLAASCGAGSGLLPIAAGPAQGGPGTELVISVLLRSAAVALILGTATVLVRLRDGGKS